MPPGVSGMPTASVHLVGANIGPNTALPVNASIELQFDRILQPVSITRQTFSLQGAGGGTLYTPSVSYDPVSRIVTITPLTDPTQVLVSGQSYQLVVNSPSSPSDVNGLRAFDGATLAAPQTIVIAFNATDAVVEPAPVTIDYCRDIEPIFSQKCGYVGSCHLASGASIMPAAGLVLEPPGFVPQTAIDMVAHGANTGPRSLPAPPSLLFGEDMPIVDGNGNASNSWLLYKVLISVPAPEPVDAGNPTSTPDAGPDAAAALPDGGADAAAPVAGDGGTDAGATDAGADDDAGFDAGPPVNVSQVRAPFALTDMPPAERAQLSNYILGLPMPSVPVGTTSGPAGPLTLDQLERVSLWISQGAKTPTSCP